MYFIIIADNLILVKSWPIVVNLKNKMTDLFQVFLLSMTPLGELRLSIPVGIAVYHLGIMPVFLVSVVGNFLPALFLAVFLNKISDYFCKRLKFFDKLFGWWKNKTQERHLEKIQKYGVFGLAIFVAIPLPLTGAWSGALLATLMNLPLKRSLPVIFIGIVIAGIIVSLTTVAGINIEKFFGYQVLLALLLILIIIYFYFNKIKK